MPPRRHPMPPRRHPISTRSTTLAPRSISHAAAATSHAAAATSHAATATSHAAGRHPAVHAHVDANGERARRDHPLVARSCAAPPSEHRLARPSPCTAPALSQREHMFEHDRGWRAQAPPCPRSPPSGSAIAFLRVPHPAFLILRSSSSFVSSSSSSSSRQPHPRHCRRRGDRFAVSLREEIAGGRTRPNRVGPGRVKLGRMSDRLQQLIALGREHYNAGELDAAEPHLAEAAAACPSYPDLYNMLGVIYHAQGRFSDAEEAFEAALRLNPRYTAAALNLSVTYNDRGKYDRAREVYARGGGERGPGELARSLRPRQARQHARRPGRRVREPRYVRRGGARVRQGARAVPRVRRPAGQARQRVSRHGGPPRGDRRARARQAAAAGLPAGADPPRRDAVLARPPRGARSPSGRR